MSRFLDWFFTSNNYPKKWIGYEVINGVGRCEYLSRWILLSAFKMHVYVHRFTGPDWSRVHHDHPRRFISIGLSGWYEDEQLIGRSSFVRRRFQAPWFRTFPAEYRHRIRALSVPCWTLVIVLRPSRKWGFWRDGEWIFWKDYVFGPHADEDKDC